MPIELYDNTRVSSHRSCNRQFYWRHVRHVVGDTIEPPLVFGACWHAAMDVVWPAVKQFKNLTDEEIRDLGYQAFLDEWSSKYNLPHPDDMDEGLRARFSFRTPNTAFFMLEHYVKRRRQFIEGVEILNIEKPFAVPIDENDPNTLYVGRRDKDIVWEGRVWAVEHKTTSWGSKNGISPNVLGSYSPNSQVDGYIHSLKMEYGRRAKGCLVDVALVKQGAYDQFNFVPVDRVTANLDAWLWELRKQIELIRLNKRDLERALDMTYMAAFEKNTNSCIQFMRPCPYLDLCKAIPNPERMPQTPQGYVEQKWSPFDEIKLEELGLKKED